MNYPLLRIGDRLPAVAVLQQLLNLNGAGLAVNGRFGGDTRTAVTRFQEANHIYGSSGVVNRETWTRLSTGGHFSVNLPIIDCIDVWDMSLYEYESADIRAAGGNPILIGGMCNGVEQAVSEILRVATGGVFLLRFHGHGADGFAGTAVGHGELSRGELSSIELENLRTLLPTLFQLRDIFGPYGCVQFMHCSTARSIRGQTMLEYVSEILNVPVSGAREDQLGGGDDTFAYEGPTYTAIPGSGTLASWGSGLPNFPDMYRTRPPVSHDPHSMMH